jgi:hypothetical protein
MNYDRSVLGWYNFNAGSFPNRGSDVFEKEVDDVKPVATLRQGRKELERELQFFYPRPECRLIRPIPGNDGIERPEVAEKRDGRLQAGKRQPVDCGGQALDAVGEANQRYDGGRGPHFGVIGFQVLEGWERYDAVADRTGPNKKSPQ